MGIRAKEGVEQKGKALKACYAESDCKVRVACMMPVIEELLAGEGKAPHP